MWAFYPPLIYLLVRMLIRGFRPRPPAARLDCRLPTAVLVLGLLALVVARIVITLHPAGVIDVGTASALGAYKLLHGQSLYYFSLGHGDTYGPIAYLAYAPFELLFWPGNVALPAGGPGGDDHLRPADDRRPDRARDARLRSGRDGWRLGLLLAWLWAACPCSLLGMAKSTNDGLVALIVVLDHARAREPDQARDPRRPRRRLQVLPGDPAAAGRGRTR